jgi:hypothetical protein
LIRISIVNYIMNFGLTIYNIILLIMKKTALTLVSLSALALFAAAVDNHSRILHSSDEHEGEGRWDLTELGQTLGNSLGI